MNIVQRLSKNKANWPDSWIYCPEGFDPAQHPGPIAEHPDSTRWLLNCIYFRHHALNLEDSDYINLHTGLLSKIMGKAEHIKPVREALVKEQLIQTDNHYIPGAKSIGYRLAPKILPSVVKWRKYHGLGAVFKKRIELFKNEVKDPKGFSLPQHYHLEKWLPQVSLSPDYVDCLCLIEKDSKRQRAEHQADSLRKGLIHRIVCPYGRFHSNYSGLCRELRQYLRVADCPLVEIDLVNSQPYFLSMLLLEIYLSEKEQNCVNLGSLLFDSLAKQTKQKEKKEREKGGKREKDHMFSFFEQLEIPEDLKNLLTKTISGTFYEIFQSGQSDRDKLKKQVFAYLYGDLNVMQNSKIAPKFEEHFPSLVKTVRQLKKTKGHRWLGQELQRRESSIVINRVASLVMDLDVEAKTIPLITIHDSILTTPEHQRTVELCLRQALSERNYFLPTFKVKSNLPTMPHNSPTTPQLSNPPATLDNASGTEPGPFLRTTHYCE